MTVGLQGLNQHKKLARGCHELVRRFLTNQLREGAGYTAAGMPLNLGNTVAPICPKENCVALTVAHILAGVPSQLGRAHPASNIPRAESKAKREAPHRGKGLLYVGQRSALRTAAGSCFRPFPSLNIFPAGTKPVLN